MMQGPVSVDMLKAGPGRAPVVLYSCIYGKREAPNPDTFGANRGVYPCFVFSDDPQMPVADGVTLVHDPLDGLDPNRASRRSKLMPERYLPPCDWSVYLDNKMQLAVDATQLIDRLKCRPEHAFFVSRHPLRDCLYDEGATCVHQKKDSAEAVYPQLQHYETLGFPRNAGLIEATFLVRRHGDDLMRRFGERWFEQVLRFSRRDQISFPFVARSLGVTPCYLDEIFDATESQRLFTRRSPPGKPSPERPLPERPLRGNPSPGNPPSGVQRPPEVARRSPPVQAGKRSFWQNLLKPYLG